MRLQAIDIAAAPITIKQMYRARMQQILKEVPDFNDILIELGYEKDGSWVQRWRQSASDKVQYADALPPPT